MVEVELLELRVASILLRREGHYAGCGVAW